MATVDMTSGDWAYPATGVGKPVVFYNRLDFSANNSGASDTVKALAIPAGTFVMAVIMKLITAEGGTLTATVGDGDSTTSWDATSVNLNTTAGTYSYSIGGTDTYHTTGKLYEADDTIDLTMSANAADAAVVDIWAIGFDLSRQ